MKKQKQNKIKISIDLAKHNSGICIYDGKSYKVLSIAGIENWKNFIKNLKKYKSKIEFLIEIVPTAFRGKYNLILQNQLLGLIYGFCAAYEIEAEFNFIYPMDWLRLYKKLKLDKKYPKELRIKTANEIVKIELKNDDEADALLMMLKFDELKNKHENKTIWENKK